MSHSAPYIRLPSLDIAMSYIARDDRPADKAARYAEVEAEILAVQIGRAHV